MALTVGGLLLLGARRLLEELGDDAHRISLAAAAIDGDANAERALRSLVGAIEVTPDSTRTFAGDERAAHFTTWCDVPAGWQERCAVTLAIVAASDAPTLTATLSTGETLVLRHGFRAGALRYLNDASEGGTWFRTWGTSITAPLALGIVLDRDTLLVRIGPRG